jgi:cytochrome P450
MADLALPPGPAKKFLGDRLLSLQRDPLGYLERLQREYGDIVHFQIGAQHIIVLNHPDFIHDVLVTHNRNFIKGYTLQQAKRVLGEGLLTSEGDYHLRQRRMMQPVFHHRQVSEYAPVIVEYAVRTGERWRTDKPFNLSKQMEGLTLAIAAKTLLGADVEADAQELGEAVSELMDLFNPVLLLLADWLEKVPLRPTRHLHRSKARLDATIYRIIAEHRAAGHKDDLLSRLLEAQDDETGGARMSDTQLRDEVLVILLAGYETIANGLSWTWYLLATHPEVQARFHAELDRVLGERLPTSADLEHLIYTRMILSEGLRMYPPVWFLDRRALTSFELAGYHIPAGATILMSQWVVQHDPRFYSEPFDFEPTRWTPEAQARRPHYAYFPFGGGPRVCIGEPFAWMEGVLVLATIGQRWRIQFEPHRNVAPQAGINLRPKGGITVHVQPRSDDPSTHGSA